MRIAMGLLTAAEAADPSMIERTAVAEFMYHMIMSERLLHVPEWYMLTTQRQNEWRVKARRLLAELVG